VVKLSNWSQVNKHRLTLESKISQRSLAALRTMEAIFVGHNSTHDAFQCDKCGNLFVGMKEKNHELKDDGKGSFFCLKCSGINDNNDEKAARFKRYGEITTAIVAFENSNKKAESFLVVQSLASGYFECNTVKEMYVNYNKFKQQLSAENADISTTLASKYKKIIDEAFDLAKNKSGEDFAKFIFGIKKDEEYEIQETVNMLDTSYIRAELEYYLPKITDAPVSIFSIGKGELDKIKFKLLLLKYGQLIEFDFIYHVLYNLGLLGKGKKYEPNLFSQDKDGITVLPNEKKLKIMSEDSKLGSLVECFFVPQLRNAIAHAKYRVENGWVSKIGNKSWKMSITQVTDKVNLTNQIFSYLLCKIGDEQVKFFENGITTLPNGDQIMVEFS
jgi:hypothetical protein